MNINNNVGDTGEKDEEAGEKIAKQYPNLIKAIFLHKVSDNKDRSKLIIPSDRTINNVPIFYFRTYAGAAKKAYDANLLSLSALNRIITQARNDLGKRDIVTDRMTSIDRTLVSTRWQELEEDIAMIHMKKITNKNQYADLFNLIDFMNKR